MYHPHRSLPVICIAFVLAILSAVGLSRNELLPISVGSAMLHVDVARTEAEQRQGLSGRSSLGSSDGMLFLFPADGRHGMWMPNMNLSLDIIWLDADKRVVHIERNVSPDSYPTVFSSPVPSRFVLELAAGQANHLGLSLGTLLSWSDNY